MIDISHLEQEDSSSSSGLIPEEQLGEQRTKQQGKSKDKENKSLQWALMILIRARRTVMKDGGRIENALHFPKMIEKVLKDVKLILIWSCILQPFFNYGSIPASTSEAENTFNFIGNVLAHPSDYPMHVHEFIPTQVEYVTAKVREMLATIQQNEPTASNVIIVEYGCNEGIVLAFIFCISILI